MVHFFGKNEMILIALMLTLFDINNLCDYAIPHILYPKKRNYIVYIFVIITLLSDVYMYYTQINEIIMPNYRYAVEKTPVQDPEDPEAPQSGKTCSEYTKNLNNQVTDWTEICKKTETRFNGPTTKAMLTILSLFLFTISTFCLIINNEETNGFAFKIIFTIPLVLVAVFILIYAYVDVKTVFTQKVTNIKEIIK